IWCFYATNSYQAVPIAQANSAGLRTNFLQDLFFLRKTAGNNNTSQWAGVGYRLYAPDLSLGVGDLYRFTVTNVALADLTGSSLALLTNPPARPPFFFPTDPVYRRVASGIVHFYVDPFDQDGRH